MVSLRLTWYDERFEWLRHSRKGVLVLGRVFPLRLVRIGFALGRESVKHSDGKDWYEPTLAASKCYEKARPLLSEERIRYGVCVYSQGSWTALP